MTAYQEFLNMLYRASQPQAWYHPVRYDAEIWPALDKAISDGVLEKKIEKLEPCGAIEYYRIKEI